MKNKITAILSIIFVAYFVISCSAVSTFHRIYYNGYDELTKGQKKCVLDADTLSVQDFFKAYPKGYALKINATQLKAAMKLYPDNLVYIFYCNCPHGIPIEFVKEYCDSLNLNLWVVSRNFDNDCMSVGDTLQSSFLVIDDSEYNTKVNYKYTSRFVVDLTNGKHSYDGKDKEVTSYLKFSRDSLTDALDLKAKCTKVKVVDTRTEKVDKNHSLRFHI